MEALTAQLQSEAQDREATLADTQAALAEVETQLSAEEQARIAEAAVAEALRERLQNADAELTAMTLALEEQRKTAEETLTLLAAANAVEADLDSRLADALIRLETAESTLADNSATSTQLRERLTLLETERDTARLQAATLQSQLTDAQSQIEALGVNAEERDATLAQLLTERNSLQTQLDTLRSATADTSSLREQLAAALAARLAAENANATQLSESERQAALLATARQELAEEEAISSEAQREAALLNQQVTSLRNDLDTLQGLLDSAAAADTAAQVRIETLGSDLNQALARAAAEERRAASEAARRAELEAAEAERLRIEAERLNEEVTDLAEYRSEFFGTLRQVLGDREGIQVVGDRFVFSSEVLFESASATLSPEGQAQIAQVAGILSDVSDQIPNAIDWIIRVDGHTDNVPLSGTGIFVDNWELSQARALSVVKFMTDALGFPPQRLAATGFGEYRPVNFDDSAAARAQNRRIELKLTER